MWVCRNCGATNPDSNDIMSGWVNENVCGYCGASRFSGPNGKGCYCAIIILLFILLLYLCSFSKMFCK